MILIGVALYTYSRYVISTYRSDYIPTYRTATVQPTVRLSAVCTVYSLYGTVQCTLPSSQFTPHITTQTVIAVISCMVPHFAKQQGTPFCK